jgi:PPP family 3-phenylpropionic acid transporter|tara:strand:+ start:2966 stop:4123 length:1158 start_codon:yes stop_codon:yes gene_type:complete
VTNILFWQLARFYFVYYFFVGLFTPYWGLYLQSLEFNALQIGFLLSLFQFSRIFAPNFWGWLADHTEERARWIRFTALVGVIGFCGIFWANTFVTMLVIMMAMSIFTSSTLPLAESLTLAHLSSHKGDSSYSKIRLWGSVGFICAAFILGFIIDQLDINAVVWALLITQVAILGASMTIPEKKVQLLGVVRRPIISVIKNPQVIFVLIGCALMVSSHGLLYNFYSIFLKSHNYSSFVIGCLWSIGVVCEIAIFLLMPKILRRINVRQVVLISLAFAVIRFYLIGAYVDHLLILIFAQMLHAATFGSFHVASIHIIEHFFNKDHHARGQTLYNSITYGVGGAIGGLGGGFMIESVGAEMTFSFSALLPLVGFLIIFFGLKDFPKNI